VKNGTRHSGQEYDLAGIYNFLGDKEKAFEWLEKAFQQSAKENGNMESNWNGSLIIK